MKARKLTPEELKQYPLFLTPQDEADTRKRLGLPDDTQIRPLWNTFPPGSLTVRVFLFW